MKVQYSLAIDSARARAAAVEQLEVAGSGFCLRKVFASAHQTRRTLSQIDLDLYRGANSWMVGPMLFPNITTPICTDFE